MHVVDAGACCGGPAVGVNTAVHLKCQHCGHDDGWRNMMLAESKRGIPCPKCNGDGEKGRDNA